LLVLPFTFKEIVNSNILQKSDNEIFQHYLYHGAIGKIIPIYENSSNIKELLKQISIDCIQKDVFKRYKIRNKNEFLKIVNFIYDQIGKKISINNVIDDFYKSKKIVYTYKTISDYIEKLENANLIKTLPYYDLKGRKIITSSLKIYSTDLGILSQNTTYSGNRS
jgi:predicted AAA+ superfamily ATPase